MRNIISLSFLFIQLVSCGSDDPEIDEEVIMPPSINLIIAFKMASLND